MRVVCGFYNFLSAEEFSPGPFFQCNSLSIQHLQQRKTKCYRRSVDGIVGHLRGKQTVWLKIVIDLTESDLQKARLTPMPHWIVHYQHLQKIWWHGRPHRVVCSDPADSGHALCPAEGTLWSGHKFSLSSRKVNAAIVHCCCDYCECMPMDIHWRGRDRLWPGNTGEVVISCCQQQEVLSLGRALASISWQH